jgi:hypothetical protein
LHATPLPQPQQQQITEIKTETPELLAALATLSTFYADDAATAAAAGTGGGAIGGGDAASAAASAHHPNHHPLPATTFLSDPASARTGLRGAIERRGLAAADEFLRAADRVAAQLDSVDGQLALLGQHCGAMRGSLGRAERAAAPLLAEVGQAQRERAQVEARRALVGRFLADYQLGAEEAAALRSAEVGPAFFAALERAGQIRERCAALLKGGSGGGVSSTGFESAAAAQRAGLELMDQMGAHQDAAYETLCRWVQSACRALGGGAAGGANNNAAAARAIDLEDADPRLTAAIAALARRPVLHRFVADEVVAARHSALFQRLILALTRGDPAGAGGGGLSSSGSGLGRLGSSGGGARPIELHAHDPRRYVADMLAWTHQALAGERELVYALFGPKDSDGEEEEGGEAAGGAPAAAAADSADTPATDADTPPPVVVDPADLLDRIFESVCRPLKARIEQVLLMQPPPLTALQVGQLLAFYQALVARSLGEKASLSVTLASLRDAARRAFMEALKAQGDRLLRAPPVPGGGGGGGASAAASDLAPPLAVPQAMALLKDLAAAHASSMADGGGGGGSGRRRQEGEEGEGDAAADDDFSAVVDAMVDPLLEACRRGGEVLSPHSASRLGGAAALDPAAHPTYLANCYEAVRGALGGLVVGQGAAEEAGAASAASSAASLKAAAVAALLADQVDALVAREAGRLLLAGGGGEAGGGGLGDVAARLRAGATVGTGDLAPERVAAALNALFALASRPDALPEFPRLQSPRLRAEAARRVGAALADAYSVAHSALAAAAAASEDGSGAAALAAVRHSPADLRTVLGL